MNNQIEVLPTSTIDDGLRLRLCRAIYGYPAMQKYATPVIRPIRTIVRNGNVTLEDVVDNKTDSNMRDLRANGISRVFSAKNHLQVKVGK